MGAQVLVRGAAAEHVTMRSITRYLPATVRIVVGLIFFIMGLNGFFFFLPQPSTPIPAGAVAFLGALFKTGYMISLVSGVELIVGLLLVVNRFVPLALVLIAPIIVNIAAYHIFLAPIGFVPAVVVTVAELYLAWVYRAAYRPLPAARVDARDRRVDFSGARPTSR